MKKRINKFLYMLVAVLLVTSCEWEPIMFDSSKSFVAFTSPTASIAEQGGKVPVPVIVTALLDAPAVTVTFEFDTAGIDPAKAAFEGVDYTLVNSEKTLSFPDGWGYDTVWIQPVDNDVFTGDKYFNAILTSNSQDYQFGAADTVLITLKDNEHPLGTWIGTYNVYAASYGNPGGWDENWVVTTEPDPDDVSNLIVTISVGGRTGNPFTATLDTDAMTITIPSGTDVGNIYGYGPTTMWVGDYASLDKTVPVEGTIQADGTILIDKVALLLTNYGDYYWDAFNTTWTKAAKKSAGFKKISPEKAARIK